MAVYRALLRLLPSSFRREFGEEMIQVVTEHREALRGRIDGLGAMRFWMRQGWAVARVALAMRLRRTHSNDRRHVVDLIGWATRDTGGGGMIGMGQDVRQAVRGMAAHPGFTALAMFTLALGIGAATAVFSATHFVLLRDLPYAEPDRIVVVFHRDLATGERGGGLSPANARDLSERATLLSDVAVAEPWGADMLTDGRAETLRAWRVSRGFFEALGVEPVAGRLFVESEYQPGQEPVVLLGHRSWTTRFGQDPALVGAPVTLEGQDVTVVGILPPDFDLPDEAELWIPRPPEPYDGQQRTADYMMGVGRLAPGATAEGASAELEALRTALAEEYPETNATLGFELVPLRDHLFGDVRTPLLVLLAAVGIVLLIACANVANLMLARGLRRQREYALRSALGASRGRLARLVGIESAILAAAGCALGIGVAVLGMEAIRRLGPDVLPRIDELQLDGTVLAFAVLAAGASSMLAGVVPSLRLTGGASLAALGEGGRSATRGRGHARAGNRLVIAEIAAAMVLAVGAGLLGRNLGTLLDRELGFESEDRLAVQLFVYQFETAAERAAFLQSVKEELEAIPGVRDVAITSTVPGATDGALAYIEIDLPFTIEDRAPPPVGQEPVASVTQVSPGVFDVLGIEVVEGRGFTDFDRADAPPVVVVNETLARRHFGADAAVGRRLVIGFEPIPREIVGVVGDLRAQGHESDPRPEVYFPLAQFGTGSPTFVLRTDVDAATLAGAAREAVWDVEPGQAVWGVATLDTLLGEWTKVRRFHLSLLGTFAAVALALAAVGVYGLVSFSVEGRVAELGIRRALGGGSASILGLILGEGMRLAAVGIMVGLAGALALTRFIQGMLWDTAPTDPLTLGAVAALMLGVAALASLVPALRALRADPAAALREE